MRLKGHYQITLNGFQCYKETYDAMFPVAPGEGYGDEVFFQIGLRHLDANGEDINPRTDRRTKTIGAKGGGRYQFGSATDMFGITNDGGIATGDMFPSANDPWKKPQPFVNQIQVPPFLISEIDLISDWAGDRTDVWTNRKVTHENVLFVTPTIWEDDPGQGIFQQYIDWQAGVDREFGQKAKEAFGGVWPIAEPVFDMVSLVIQTAETLPNWLGKPVTRPIGTQVKKTGNTSIELSFDPQVLILSQASAEAIFRQDVGYGFSVHPMRYIDGGKLDGDYEFYIGVERIGPLVEIAPDGVETEVTPSGPIALSTISRIGRIPRPLSLSGSPIRH